MAYCRRQRSALSGVSGAAEGGAEASSSVTPSVDNGGGGGGGALEGGRIFLKGVHREGLDDEAGAINLPGPSDRPCVDADRTGAGFKRGRAEARPEGGAPDWGMAGGRGGLDRAASYRVAPRNGFVPSLPPHCPPSLRDLILSCTCSEPKVGTEDHSLD